MLKGVSHQIVEIRQTDDPYFERALLFVRPEYAGQTQDRLQEKGYRFVKNRGSYEGLRQSRAICWFKRCVLFLTGGIGGVILGAVLTQLE